MGVCGDVDGPFRVAVTDPAGFVDEGLNVKRCVRVLNERQQQQKKGETEKKIVHLNKSDAHHHTTSMGSICC